MNRIIILIIFIAICCSATVQKQKSTIEKLQGSWQSIDDSLSVIKIQGHKQIDFYDGKKLSEGYFNS